MVKIKMAKKIILLIFILLLILPTIFAATTDIKIKTLQNHRIFVAILKTGEIYSVIETFPYKSTGIMGDLNYKTTSDYQTFDLKITLKLGDNIIKDQRIENITAGGKVFVNFTPHDVKVGYENALTPPAVQLNETLNQSLPANETSIIPSPNVSENQTPAIPSPLTGEIIGQGLKANMSKIITYVSITIILAVVIILIIFFIVKNKTTFKMPSAAIKFRHKNEEYSKTEKELVDAERKLKEARDEIEKIRKRDDLIKEAERKLNEDKDRLQKLKNERR